MPDENKDQEQGATPVGTREAGTDDTSSSATAPTEGGARQADTKHANPGVTHITEDS